jgi:hypothetical protein
MEDSLPTGWRLFGIPGTQSVEKVKKVEEFLMKQLMSRSFIIFSVVALFSPSAFSEIKVTDNLSVSGFLDMSSVRTDNGEDTNQSLSFDQFEIDFLFNYGSVAVRADVDSTGGLGGQIQGARLEQGFVTYTFPEASAPVLSVTAGRFLSSFGWEAAEPTGLYQFSVSEGIPYPGYQNGVAVSVKPVKQVGLYAALVSGVWSAGDTDLENPGIETQVSLTPVEQVTAKIGYAWDDQGDDVKRRELNAWASISQGPLLVAGEIDLLWDWPSVDGDGNDVIRKDGIHFLGMANLSLKDVINAPLGVTVRFSGIELDEEDMSTEITVSPSISFSDNWLGVFEFKRLIDKEVTQIAVESLFSF